MTLEKTLKKVAEEYEKAKKLEYVRNPLAFALYRVWRLADSQKEQVSSSPMRSANKT